MRRTHLKPRVRTERRGSGPHGRREPWAAGRPPGGGAPAPGEAIEVCSWPVGPSRWIVSIGGEVDLGSAAGVETAVHGVCEAGVETVILDVREVTFIDVAGFRALDRACRDCACRGARLSLLIRRDGPVERLLHLLRLEPPGRPRLEMRGASIHLLDERAGARVP